MVNQKRRKEKKVILNNNVLPKKEGRKKLTSKEKMKMKKEEYERKQKLIQELEDKSMEKTFDLEDDVIIDDESSEDDDILKADEDISLGEDVIVNEYDSDDDDDDIESMNNISWKAKKQKSVLKSTKKGRKRDEPLGRRVFKSRLDDELGDDDGEELENVEKDLERLELESEKKESKIHNDPVKQDLKNIKRERGVAKYMTEMIQKEEQRSVMNGAKVKVLQVKNTAIIRDSSNILETKDGSNSTPEKGAIFNRIEVKSSENFDEVEHLLLSESVDCPVKNNYSYVNVILFFKGSKIAHLLPYVYPNDQDNNLSNWILVNKDLKRTKFTISSFKNINQ